MTKVTYGYEVFEYLQKTLEVVLTNDARIACDDTYIKPNYEIRDTGVYLKPGEMDSLNWTPVCDLSVGPGSPDPLVTPALPFPFTARELAAFMLDGWGACLAERFAKDDGELDTEVVKLLLGGVNLAKPREAIAAAFGALGDAKKYVGEPDSSLAQAEAQTHSEYIRVHDEADRATAWREVGITEEERRSRVQRRNEHVAEAKAAYQAAKSRSEHANTDWRRAIVRWLMLNVGEAKAGDLMAEAEFRDGFSTVAEGQGLNAERWAKLAAVEAKPAAMLICGINPAVYPDPERSAPTGADLSRFRLTLAALESAGRDGGSRSLQDWAAVACDVDLQVDPRVRAMFPTAVSGMQSRERGGVNARRIHSTQRGRRNTLTPVVDGAQPAAINDRLLAAYRGGARNVSALAREYGVPRRTINRVLSDAGLKTNKK